MGLGLRDWGLGQGFGMHLACLQAGKAALFFGDALEVQVAQGLKIIEDNLAIAGLVCDGVAVECQLQEVLDEEDALEGLCSCGRSPRPARKPPSRMLRRRRCSPLR